MQAMQIVMWQIDYQFFSSLFINVNEEEEDEVT